MADRKPWSRWRFAWFHLKSMKRSFFYALSYLVVGVPQPKDSMAFLGATSHHPSDLCKCDDREAHDPGCGWAAVMCKTCSGSGYCSKCGGDGCQSGRAK